mgnify:CR=1 FL=1
MVEICPTVTASTLDEFNRQLNLLSEFTSHIHIDYMDGVFTTSKSPSLDEISFKDNLKIDLHLMSKEPDALLPRIYDLKPNLVLIHYEARVDHIKFAKELNKHNIKAGLVILQETRIEDVMNMLVNFDQLLIFSGHLGYQGGVSDLKMLDKVRKLHSFMPGYEVAWDGGVNLYNIKEIVDGGVRVLNVGKSITLSDNPKESFNQLMLKLN